MLPPYLVGGPQAGLAAYVEAIAAASPLPVIIYHRGTAQYSVDTVRRLARNPQVIGFKDGVGDVGLAQQIVRAVAEEGRDDFAFFNGLLTAELTQGAYRGIGIPLYSSAAFAMIPEVANAYYRAYIDGDETRRAALLDGFYSPLVRLRDETPGFGVSLIKAGLRLSGLAGRKRAPAARRPDTRAGGASRRHPRRGARAAVTTISSLDARLIRVPLTRPWAADVTSVGVIATHVVRSDGAEGWGFSWTPQIGAEAVHALIEHDIAAFAVGRAAEPGEEWQPLWQHLHEAGGGGITTIALAGLDLALWDAAARAAGTSRLGLPRPAARDSVRAYGSGVNLHYTAG